MIARLCMFFREFACRLVGHDWQAVQLHELGGTRKGRLCMRCLDAEARVYRGQHPLPR